jgi:hypothetical protein
MSCSEEEVHFNDIGTVFLVTVNDCVSGTASPLDLTGATDLKLIFKSPAGTRYEKSALYDSDGSDGKIKYTTVDGDLNEVGTWRIQAYIVLGGTWRSDVGTFKVYENL